MFFVLASVNFKFEPTTIQIGHIHVTKKLKTGEKITKRELILLILLCTYVATPLRAVLLTNPFGYSELTLHTLMAPV